MAPTMQEVLRRSNEIMYDVGNNIKKWRTVQGIKQEWLASQIGITRVAMSKIETGKTNISITRLAAICMLLNIEPNQIFIDPLTILFHPD
jgi:transcriptional regulator with XRE-family HTH domain